MKDHVWFLWSMLYLLGVIWIIAAVLLLVKLAEMGNWVAFALASVGFVVVGDQVIKLSRLSLYKMLE